MLGRIINDPDTIHFFQNTSHPYFFHGDRNTNALFLKLHTDQLEFDRIFNGFTEFDQEQLIQSFLIDEIQATNEIENIFLTKQGIFSLMQGKEEKYISIVHAYTNLVYAPLHMPQDFARLRGVYDQLMAGVLTKEDQPDGTYFRRNIHS